MISNAANDSNKKILLNNKLNKDEEVKSDDNNVKFNFNRFLHYKIN